jgi:hypothetical protein
VGINVCVALVKFFVLRLGSGGAALVILFLAFSMRVPVVVAVAMLYMKCLSYFPLEDGT